jgi:MYXO-CTERM domain-containing protein
MPPSTKNMGGCTHAPASDAGQVPALALALVLFAFARRMRPRRW